MTKIKLCGLSRRCDIEAANELRPDYIGFVFSPKSKRYVTPEQAMEPKRMLSPEIQAVGVFVDEAPETVADLLNNGVIDMAQLHGEEDENEIAQLRRRTDKPIVKAFLQPARYMSVGGIMECWQKPLEVYNYETLKDDPLIDVDTIGLKGSSHECVQVLLPPPLKGAGMMMEGADKAAVEKLVSILNDKHII